MMVDTEEKKQFARAHFFTSTTHLELCQNKAPPYLAEMRNIPWKLRIAFSDTIYSKTILRVSCCTTDYLSENEPLCNMNGI